MRRTFRLLNPALVTLVSGSLLGAVVMVTAGTLVVPVWAHALGGALVGLCVAVAARRASDRAAQLDVTEPRVLRLLVRSFEAVVQEQDATLTELEQRLRDAEEVEQLRQAGADSQGTADHRRRETVAAALGHLQGPTAGARVDAAVGRLGATHGFTRPSLAPLPPAAPSTLPPQPDQVESSPAEPQAVLPVPPPPVEAVQRPRRLFRARAA